jgi:hypothetical protein
MRNKFKQIMFLGLLLTSMVVNAADPKNYVGIDYKIRSMKGRNLNSNVMSNIFPKSYSSTEVYAAHRFDNDVGLSIGLEKSKTEKKNYTFGAGELFMNDTESAGDRTSVRAHIQAAHFDVNGYYNFNEKFEAIGQLGLALMHVAMDASFTSAAGVTSNMGPSSNYQVIPRVGVGAQYFMWRNFGVRGLLNWEGTNMYRLKITDDDGIRRNIKAFRQSWSAVIGLVAKF